MQGDSMNSTFPILRLPQELQIQILKLHIQPFAIWIIPDLEPTPAPRLKIGALNKDKFCILYLCSELREVGKQPILESFNSELEFILYAQYSARDLFEYFNVTSPFTLPLSLPLERVRVVHLRADPASPIYQVLNFVTGANREYFTNSFPTYSRLQRLENIEIDCMQGPPIILLTEDVQNRTYDLFLNGDLDADLVQWIEAELQAHVAMKGTHAVRSDGKIIALHVHCTWFPSTHNGGRRIISGDYFQLSVSIVITGQVRVMKRTAFYEKDDEEVPQLLT